jgi:hypothetical protein
MAYPMLGPPEPIEGEVIRSSEWDQVEGKPQKPAAYTVPYYLTAGHNKLDKISSLLNAIHIYKDQYSRACFRIIGVHQNAQVFLVGSENGRHALFKFLLDFKHIPNSEDIKFLFSRMQSYAEHFGDDIHVFYRIAPSEGGVEIDTGRSDLVRIKISAGHWSVLQHGSAGKFLRFNGMQELPLPADGASCADDINLLKRYLSTDWLSFLLVVAWIVYTIITPKIHSSNFLILAINAVAGSGKSLFTKILLLLIDPTVVGIRTFPQNKKAVAIAAQSSHVIAYDNMRKLSKFMSDLLCQLASGGVLTDRELYSDDGEAIINVHAALILNGIHHFVEEPDLADRCLPIELEALTGDERIPEHELLEKFYKDRPFILRGIYQLAADVLKALPSVTPSHPVRMVEFARTLAAVEAAQGIPTGTLQEEYAERLQNIKRDAVLSDPVMEAMLEFANNLPSGSSFSISANPAKEWTGTPTELLVLLGDLNGKRYRYHKQFPDNAISLSKRLRVLVQDLLKEGVEVRFKRSKVRQITIIFSA